MNTETHKLPCSFAANPAASPNEIRKLRALYRGIPDDYLRFLLVTDGGEGWLGDGYFVFWRASELRELNRDYGADEDAPDFLLFGSNGGGESFAFDRVSSPWTVGYLPFLGLSRTDFELKASSFADFLHQALSSIERRQ